MTIATFEQPPVPLRSKHKFHAQTLVLPFTLPGFNELLTARGRRTDRSNEYAEWKARVQPTIAALARKQLVPMAPPIWVRFTWYEADQRRDPLDVRGSSKAVMDALCDYDRQFDTQARAGIIHCDGWHCIEGGTDFYRVDRKNPRIEVVLYGCRRG